MSFLSRIFRSQNVLYYPGCLTKFVAKDLLDNYRRILRQAKIDFIELSNIELCCGSPALKAGYFKNFQELAEKNLKIFQDHGVTKIITNCPACFMIFKKEYADVLGEKWDIKVEHISETLAEAMKNGKKNENYPLVFASGSAQPEGHVAEKLEIKSTAGGTITYHDPCHLGRQMGVYEAPREVIKKLGYDIKEMTLNKIESYCCGGGGGVKSNEPELSNQIARDRIKQAKETGAPILVTSCPLCYMNLKENSQGLEVKELSQLFTNDKK
jgi:heterodisulfide reductase subunit D